MTDLRSLTVQAVALKVLEDRVKTRRGEVNRELEPLMGEGDRKKAILADGTAVGAVTFTEGSTKARLVNETQLTAWVRETHPDELVSVIRPSFLAALLGDAQKAGAPVTRDGELLPGVDVVKGTGYLTVRPDPEAVHALVEAIRANQDIALGITDGE